MYSFINDIKSRDDIDILEVTSANRDDMPKTIADIELTKWSKSSYDKGVMQLAKPDLNFAGCFRVILAANKGEVGMFY